MWPVDINASTYQSDEIGEEYCVPAFDGVTGEREVGLAQYKVRTNEVVCCSHGENTSDH